MDKRFWHRIIDANGALPPGNAIATLTAELTSYLGSTDGELRDDIAYRLLTQWILSGQYALGDLRVLMSGWLNNLSVGIGEQDSDTVFLRSFSVLMLGVLVYQDNNAPFLTGGELHTLFDTGLAYFAAEQDLRGYVVGKGWAHSIAHSADLLKFLARNRHISAPDLERLLNAIADKLTAPVEHMYSYDEDERLALAVVSVVNRGALSADTWMAWLGRFLAWSTTFTPGASFQLRIYAPQHNVKQFLRTLYFQLLSLEPMPAGVDDLPAAIIETLRAFQ
jgi:hypothetical protein